MKLAEKQLNDWTPHKDRTVTSSKQQPGDRRSGEPSTARGRLKHQCTRETRWGRGIYRQHNTERLQMDLPSLCALGTANSQSTPQREREEREEGGGGGGRRRWGVERDVEELSSLFKI